MLHRLSPLFLIHDNGSDRNLSVIFCNVVFLKLVDPLDCDSSWLKNMIRHFIRGKQCVFAISICGHVGAVLLLKRKPFQTSFLENSDDADGAVELNWSFCCKSQENISALLSSI